ncbi:ATP-dependent peptidase [Hibiscus syriacus]|uniref:ATP-dependent peptidase n=1 Tax=Hibiscus syriacus TaxID=106335 RepID=A0A6A3CNB4_HIBSY|nr:ATP-dependent peptidase [Hibiscus syriacus]
MRDDNNSALPPTYHVSHKVLKKALSEHSHDNISVIVVGLKNSKLTSQNKLQKTDGTQRTPHVWTAYEGLTGDLSTPSSRHKGFTQGNELGSGEEADAGFETERTFEKAKNDNLSNGDEIQKAKNACYSPKENTEGMSRKKAFLDNGLGLGDILGNKKKGKGKFKWVCEICGYSDGQWWGVCRSCDRSGTMKKFMEGETKNRGLEFSETLARSWLPKDAGNVEPVKLIDVNRGVKKMDYRIPLLIGLIGGDPGVGKSTLLLQMAALIAEGHDCDQPACVVYVSGEEDILKKIQPLSPRALIVDSVQTVYLKEVTGSAGGLSQAGHVTKSGDIAGPRVLEHIVDAVLSGSWYHGLIFFFPFHYANLIVFILGEKCSSHRLLRSVKNRFGSVDELGIFEMSQLGLQTVLNPSEMFLSDQNSDSEFLAGLAVAVIMDGSRAFLIEIQALCVSSSTVSRHVNGIQASRADMIISVLAKQAGLKIQENAVFLNVVSGVSLTETAGDLAIAHQFVAASRVSYSSGVAFIGEIGLGGEIRMVPRMDKRVSTVAKLDIRSV